MEVSQRGYLKGVEMISLSNTETKEYDFEVFRVRGEGDDMTECHHVRYIPEVHYVDHMGYPITVPVKIGSKVCRDCRFFVSKRQVPGNELYYDVVCSFKADTGK